MTCPNQSQSMHAGTSVVRGEALVIDLLLAIYCFEQYIHSSTVYTLSNALGLHAFINQIRTRNNTHCLILYGSISRVHTGTLRPHTSAGVTSRRSNSLSTVDRGLNNAQASIADSMSLWEEGSQTSSLLELYDAHARYVSVTQTPSFHVCCCCFWSAVSRACCIS